MLAGLDVVVNPSMEESASYAMVEALLMERGVVASNVGGLPDTVQHGETGLLVPPGDPRPWPPRQRNCGRPRQKRRMGRLGRARRLRQFDIAATVASLEAVYRQALRELPRTRPDARPDEGSPAARGGVAHD